MKKSSDARGDIHKDEILKFIKGNSSEDWFGFEVNEIVKHKHLSRQTVTEHLNKLVAEGEIKKTRRGTYLPAEIFDDLVYDGSSYLEDYLNTHLPLIVQDNTVPNLRTSKNHYASFRL
jgi:predicted transcriptional regulator